MKSDRLIQQIQAQMPDMQHSMAASFLFEFVERLKTDGRTELIALPVITNQGYARKIPDKVRSIIDVYIDGSRIGQEMSIDNAVYYLSQFPDQVLQDENGATLTDVNDQEIED